MNDLSIQAMFWLMATGTAALTTLAYWVGLRRGELNEWEAAKDWINREEVRLRKVDADRQAACNRRLGVDRHPADRSAKDPE